MSALAKRLPSEDGSANPEPKPRPAHLFKPGQSGNPGGKPKRLAELRALSIEVFPDAIERLKRLIASDDDDLAFRAVQFTYLYVLGKPSEGRELAHIEAMMKARMAEFTIQPQEQLSPVVTHDARREVVETPVTVTEAAGESVEPPTSVPLVTEPEVKALRCIYRGESGQCESLAADGVSWCGPHRLKLFEAMK